MNVDNREPKPTVEKEYTSAFLLDRAKASRVLNILEERFSNLQLKFEPIYSVQLLRGNRLSLNSIEDVFRLDNTIRNPIKTLRIEVSDADPTRSIDLKCGISFNAPRDSLRDNVSIYVKSFDSKLALQTFAALEEQVQRAFLDDSIYQILKGRVSESLFFVFPLLFTIPFIFLSPSRVFREELSSEQLKLLLAAANSAKTSDEKINFLFEITKQEIEKKQLIVQISTSLAF